MEFTFESSLSFVLKLLICQLFISVYICRFSTRVPPWSQSSRKPGQTFSLKRVDLGTSSTFEGNLVGAQPTWTVQLPGNREAEPCQRVVLAIEPGSVSPKVARRHYSFNSKGVRNGILPGYTKAKGVGRRSALKSTFQPEER